MLNQSVKLNALSAYKMVEEREIKELTVRLQEDEKTLNAQIGRAHV